MEKILGINAVLEYLESGKENLEKIYFFKGIKNNRIQKIIEIIKSRNILYSFVPEEKLNKLSNNERHQGVVAFYSGFKYTELDELNFNDNSLIVVLDQVTDPHNLGAIIRSAVASCVDAVIIPERNSVSVTDVVLKVSAGTAIKIPIVKVGNLNRCLEKLKKLNFWIVGTDGNSKQYYDEYNFDGKNALVMGSEGKGMRRLIRENCDSLIKIPLHNGVESLNVSVAASIVFFQALKQRKI